VRAGDVARHQIGGELDAREVERQARGERAYEQRLAEPRISLQEHVPGREQAPEHLIDDGALPEDAALDRGLEPFDIGARMGEACFEAINHRPPVLQRSWAI